MRDWVEWHIRRAELDRQWRKEDRERIDQLFRTGLGKILAALLVGCVLGALADHFLVPRVQNPIIFQPAVQSPSPK